MGVRLPLGALKLKMKVTMHTLEQIYSQKVNEASDINEHLPTLRKYAEQCDHVTEFGVRWICSTWALLVAKPKILISYDIIEPSNILSVAQHAKQHGVHFEFKLENTLEVDIEPTELLFIDTLHTYTQLNAELEMHAEKVSRFIILHDTVSFGTVGEDRVDKGLNFAIDEFIQATEQWKVLETFTNNNGLTVLSRI